MNAPAIGQKSSSRVLFPITPALDESLPGYLARVAAWNFIEKPATILERAGADGLSNLSERITRHADEVANCLGVPKAALLRMTMLGNNPKGGEVSYFGTEIRRTRLHHRDRHVAPATLEISPHHRAVWLVRPIAWCSETWDFLISNCPSCGRTLGFLITRGIDFCERCNFDLKRAPTSKVPEELRPALALPSALVSHAPKVREEALQSAPEVFRSLRPTALLELVVATSRALLDRRDQYPTPVEIAAGVSTLMDYPRSFERLVDAHADNATSAPFFRRLEIAQCFMDDPDIGDLVPALLEPFQPAAHGPTHKRNRREQLGLMTGRQVARQLGLESSTLATLVRQGTFPYSRLEGPHTSPWFSPEDVEAVGKRLAERVSGVAFERDYGLPRCGVEQLVSVGLLRVNDDPLVVAAHPNLQLEKASVADLIDRVHSALWRPRPNHPALSLSDAFMAIGASDKPWAALIQALLSDTLPDGLSMEPGAPLRFDALTVTPEFALDLARGRHPEILVSPPRDPRLGPPADFSRTEVERYLNCFPRDVAWMLANGHLTPPAERRHSIPRSEVEALGQDLISSREISWRWRVSPALREALPTDHGIARVLGPFWPRPAVTAHFAAMFPTGGPV